MKDNFLIHFLVQSILFVTVGCFTVIPAFIGAMTAPMHSPALAEKAFCPEDTTIEVDSYQSTWNEPGESTISVSCVDATGNHYSATEGNEGALLALIGRFFLISLGVLFIPLSLGTLMVTRWATRVWSRRSAKSTD